MKKYNRYPQNAMRSFGIYISKIDWSKSESLKELFLPFMYLERKNQVKKCNNRLGYIKRNKLAWKCQESRD